MAASSRDIQLSELKDMISDLNMTIKTLNHTIARQQSENDNLKAELAWFRQKLFGSSSERRMEDVAGQLNLFETLPEEEKPVELIEPEVVELPKKPRKKKPTLDKQFEGIAKTNGKWCLTSSTNWSSACSTNCRRTSRRADGYRGRSSIFRSSRRSASGPTKRGRTSSSRWLPPTAQACCTPWPIRWPSMAPTCRQPRSPRWASGPKTFS